MRQYAAELWYSTCILWLPPDSLTFWWPPEAFACSFLGGDLNLGSLFLYSFCFKNLPHSLIDSTAHLGFLHQVTQREALYCLLVTGRLALQLAYITIACCSYLLSSSTFLSLSYSSLLLFVHSLSLFRLTSPPILLPKWSFVPWFQGCLLWYLKIVLFPLLYTHDIFLLRIRYSIWSSLLQGFSNLTAD